MNIKIQQLTLTNFKCYRHKEFTFNDDITVIQGRHGVGKTTTADAIFWCLFGKNSIGQASFSIKTKDSDGNDIPHLDHSVEMLLSVLHDNRTETVTLRRTLKEIWVSKRGTTEQVLKNNTTEYMVNGEVVTAKDYERYVSQLIPEEQFKTITNPHYFTSLKWQTQREFLSQLVSDITSDDVAGQDDDLRAFISSLGEDADIVAHRKHLSYQIKKVKEKLDNIPVRLEEQNKALPEFLNWDGIQGEVEQTRKELARVDSEILAIKSGNGSDVEKEHIRTQLKDLQQQIDDIEHQERSLLLDLRTKRDTSIAEANSKFNSLLNTQRDLEASIQSFDTLIERCRTNSEEHFRSEQAYIHKHWPETQAHFHGSDSTACPVCHQPLPPDMMHEAEQSFNLRKAELKQQLTQRATEAKKLLADAKQQVKEYEAQKAEAQKNLATTKQTLTDVFSVKAKLEKQEIPTIDQRLKENAHHASLLQQKSQLTEQLQKSSTDEEQQNRLAELEASKAQLAQTLANLNDKLSSKSQYDRIQKLIQDILADQQQLLEQKSELERQEDIVKRYQSRENQILEDRVNKHFSMVRWRMFRTVNNGGEPFDEPYCECYVNGIAYHDGLNQAARLNAGLDIINCLCRHYGISAPIIIDQSESVLDYLQTQGQQIRLLVAPTDLQIH